MSRREKDMVMRGTSTIYHVKAYPITDNGQGYSVTVTVGVLEDETLFAFCPCETFRHIDRGQRYTYPQRYFGATGPHGCSHIDYAVEVYLRSNTASSLAVPPARRTPAGRPGRNVPAPRQALISATNRQAALAAASRIRGTSTGVTDAAAVFLDWLES